MKEIRLNNLCKAFDGRTVLENLSAVIPAGKITGVTAPSGAGKTTLLRILAGLETPDSGCIAGLDGCRRSMVFQEDRLCESLTAAENIRLVTPRLTPQDAENALAGVGLQDCVDRPVRELSGGMKRRVALLRALLADYDLLLLDEPFKGLDAGTKAQVMADVRRRCTGRTVILVTHVPEELDAVGAESRLTLPFLQPAAQN